MPQTIIYEIYGNGAIGALALAVYFSVLPSPWMIVLGLVFVVHCVMLRAALSLVRHHAHPQSITVVCIANWTSALLVTFILPVALPVMVLTSLLPVVFAQRYVRGRRLEILTVVAACAVLAVTVLARVQDVSGISARLPSLAVTVLIVTILPILAARLLMIAWNNGATLRSTTAQLTASRARLISVADEERRRLERDLHDGAQQQLVALAVLIQLARRADGNQSEALLLEASTLLETAIAEIRRLAHGIYPPLLVDGGLAQALPAAARHSAVPVHLDLRGLARYSAPIEAALYYCCTEALQNAAKHGGPDTTVTITARADERMLNLTISDTGRGFDPATTGTGLTNMTDRLAAIGGTLLIDTAPGSGTRISASVNTSALTSTGRSAQPALT